jgi:hypothetical protein
MRDTYLWGFMDGGNSSYTECANVWLKPGEWFKKPESERVKKVREKTAMFFPLESIRDVITDLYKEPANSYINFNKIVYIARNKLRGELIEDQLRDARRSALELHLRLQEQGIK